MFIAFQWLQKMTIVQQFICLATGFQWLWDIDLCWKDFFHCKNCKPLESSQVVFCEWGADSLSKISTKISLAFLGVRPEPTWFNQEQCYYNNAIQALILVIHRAPMLSSQLSWKSRQLPNSSFMKIIPGLIANNILWTHQLEVLCHKFSFSSDAKSVCKAYYFPNAPVSWVSQSTKTQLLQIHKKYQK